MAGRWERGVGPGRLWATVLGVLLGIGGCAEEKPASDRSEASTEDEGDDGETPEEEEPVAVGPFSVEGQLVHALSGSNHAAELCLSLWDPTEVGRGEPPALLWEGRSDAAGSFVIDGVDPGNTLGLLLQSEACEGADPVPAARYLDVGEWAGLGPGRALSGVSVPVLPEADRDALDAELLASGAGTLLADGGGILGTIIDPDWGPVEGGWVRGPDPTEEAWYAPWYDKGEGEWKSYDGSSAAGGARFAVPAAPWGAWLCRASETDFPVLIGGGIEGTVLVHEFQPW